LATISVNAAAKQFEVSRPTLLKHLKSGKLTGAKVGKSWQIDTSELVRVYKPRGGDVESVATKETVNISNDLHSEVDKLREELESAKTQLAVATALAEDRQRTLDQMVQQLTDQTPPKRNWWPFGWSAR